MPAWLSVSSSISCPGTRVRGTLTSLQMEEAGKAVGGKSGGRQLAGDVRRTPVESALPPD